MTTTAPRIAPARLSSTRTLPSSTTSQSFRRRLQLERLLQTFEVEKLVYELRYELMHRPDWVHIPVTGIGRLLERSRA